MIHCVQVHIFYGYKLKMWFQVGVVKHAQAFPNFGWAWLNAKMLSANRIAGFLNFNISKTIGVIKLISCMDHGCTYLLKLQIAK